MAKYIAGFLIFLLSNYFLLGCNTQKSEEQIIRTDLPDSDSIGVSLVFSLEIDKKIYQQTNFGEPPQLAIWIESLDSSIVKTVFVTHCTAKQDWRGKVECPVSLPFWEHRKVQEQKKFNDKPTVGINPDAVSRATPRNGRVNATIYVPKNSQWNYYLEVNVSADYNHTFSYWSSDGLPDTEANGQPSLVYKGSIIANGVDTSVPKLWGRTKQRQAVKEVSQDLSGITTASKLIRNMMVTSTEK